MNETWPAFSLMDSLPQGYGRKELLRQLNYSENAQEQADWALLSWSWKPIGHLRIKEAYEWLQRNFHHQNIGFNLSQIIDEIVLHRIARLYGLFIAGSSGVQGALAKGSLPRT